MAGACAPGAAQALERAQIARSGLVGLCVVRVSHRARAWGRFEGEGQGKVRALLRQRPSKCFCARACSLSKHNSSERSTNREVSLQDHTAPVNIERMLVLSLGAKPCAQKRRRTRIVSAPLSLPLSDNAASCEREQTYIEQLTPPWGARRQSGSSRQTMATTRRPRCVLRRSSSPVARALQAAEQDGCQSRHPLVVSMRARACARTRQASESTVVAGPACVGTSRLSVR